MKSSRKPSASPRTPRRWRTPPPITRGPEPLEGMDLLREVGGETAALLWQAYRNVMFWATADRDERATLFSASAAQNRMEDLKGANLPADLVDPLVAVGKMLGAPQATSSETVSDACVTVADWACRNGFPITQISFTQAAALASQRSARLAHRVGRLARERGDFPRAETWYRHAIMVARQTGDWESYVRSYIGLGTMFKTRGNYPMAHRMHIKALRAARRKGLGELLGLPLHDLFAIAVETNRFEQAQEYARGAFRSYGPAHPNLPRLAGDVAYFWMNQGRFERALPVLQALVPYFPQPVDQLRLNANITRAAGGAEDRESFRRAWNEALLLSRQLDENSTVSEALYEMGLGASSLGEWDRAEQVLRRAVEIAERRGENAILIRAETALEAVAAGRRVDIQRSNAKKLAEREQGADTLAERFVESLRGGMAHV